MKLSDRVDIMDKALVSHIEESGEIRADLKWLKKMIWGIFGVIGADILARFFH